MWNLVRRNKFNILRAIQAVIIGFSDYFNWHLVVMSRHRGRNLPFGRAGIPKIASRYFSMFQTAEEVDEENQDREANQERGNGHNEMLVIETKSRIIIYDAAAHPFKADDHHTDAQYKERRRHQPKMDFAPKFAHTATGSFRI